MRWVAVAREGRDWISFAVREAEKWARKVEARSVMGWEVAVVVLAMVAVVVEEGGEGERRRLRDMRHWDWSVLSDSNAVLVMVVQ